MQSQNNDQRPSCSSTPQGGNYSSIAIQDQFSRSALFAVDFFKRFVKLSLLGVLVVGVTGAAAYEGAHMWVENIELAPETDIEVKRWEWDRDRGKWSGGDMGGTDPALGFKGRHAVRAAWMAENWGSGSQTGIFRASSPDSQESEFNIIEARLGHAQGFLSAALQVAEDTMSSGKLHRKTPIELAARHAGVLERIGTRDAFFDARTDYERVWSGLSDTEPEAARAALKLGDLNFRLGDYTDAVKWWTRTIGMTQGTQQAEDATPPTVSQTVPSSPFAQRTLASAMVSLSAYYSISAQLQEAKQAQEVALALLRSISSPPNVLASPPHMLHSLYILHRSSLISIHLAEVLYTLKSPRQSSLQHLLRAAESAERVAWSLSGRTAGGSDQGTTLSKVPPAETALLQVFSKSSTMRKPAKGLLRDARRTAAEAWNLIGILSEEDGGGNNRSALEYYERALAWAGAPTDAIRGSRRPAEGIPEVQWQALWKNYVRAREAVRVRDGKQSE